MGKEALLVHINNYFINFIIPLNKTGQLPGAPQISLMCLRQDYHNIMILFIRVVYIHTNNATPAVNPHRVCHIADIITSSVKEKSTRK